MILIPTVDLLIVPARAGGWSRAADDSPSLLQELRDRKELAVLPWGSACHSQHSKHKPSAPPSKPHSSAARCMGRSILPVTFLTSAHVPQAKAPDLVFPFLVQHRVTLLWWCQEGQAWLSPVPGPWLDTRHGRGEGAILGQGLAGGLWAQHSPAARLQTVKAG